jgi:hypothetical protein
MEAKPKLKDDVLYSTDNGALLCGQHCGMSARYTGRDISGQRVEKVTPDEVRYFEAEGLTAKCETCGRRATAVARPDGAAMLAEAR